MMNIQAFSMPGAAYFNPTAYGDLSGANYWVWVLSHVLFDQKFMTIFSMLFGAGIVLLTTRIEERGGSAAHIHYRRTLWLLIFGAAHAYLLWYGDILFLYAVCALVVYPFRKRSPRTLIITGLAIIAVGSGIWFATGFSMSFWSEAQILAFEREEWSPPPEIIQDEIAAYQGSWVDQMRHRVPTSFEFQTLILLIWGIWRAGGLMLVGMGLYKLGVLSGLRTVSFYRRLFVICSLIGIPIVIYGVKRNFDMQWDVRFSFFLGTQFNYWGSLLVSLAWVGGVMLACRSGALVALTSRLAAVGRLAFTNYLLQTILCTLLFYGHGLGYFGNVPRIGQVSAVVIVWVLQLVFSPLWLRGFRMGPFEWAWRSLTYWKLQPLAR